MVIFRSYVSLPEGIVHIAIVNEIVILSIAIVNLYQIVRIIEVNGLRAMFIYFP